LPIISQHTHFCKHYVNATKNGQENLYIADSRLSITELYDFWYAACSRKEIQYKYMEISIFIYLNTAGYPATLITVSDVNPCVTVTIIWLYPLQLYFCGLPWCITHNNNVPYIGIYNHQKQKKFWSKHTIIMTNCKRTLQTNP
jgi:hypothetical protein